MRASIRPICYLSLAVTALSVLTGCPVVSNLPSPGRTSLERDVETGRAYHLYVPSNYSDRHTWPLLITCHGTPPWDTATAQLDEWKGYAEGRGFLVAAPELVGTRGDWTPPPEQQIRLEMEDERAILSIVRSIQASHDISPSRIFISGWSAGNFAALFAGLRNPNVFRAISIRQGNFSAAFFEPCIPFIDPNQSIQITIGQYDVLVRDQGLACVEWLKARGMQPSVIERTGIHRRDPEPVLEFFIDVARKRPWLRILTTDDPNDPMKIGFRTLTSFEGERYLWDFGDGSTRLPLARPEHVYDKPGLYTVRVAVWPTGQSSPIVRSIPLQMPRMRFGAGNIAASAPAP